MSCPQRAKRNLNARTRTSAARIAVIDKRGRGSLSIINKFVKLLIYRSILFLYLFILITAGALAFYIFPITEILSGLIALTDSNVLSSVVSFAQWLIADGVIQYTFMLILAAPAPIALVCSLLFAGAFGSFAKGMEKIRRFPAKPGMSFLSGYHNRFMQVFALFFIVLVLGLLMIFVWIISAIPLAVINELVSRGAMQQSVFYALLAVTALSIYAGMLFLRIYSMAFIPALYSKAHRPLGSAFSFAGRHFFRVAKYFLLTDIVLALQFAMYNYSDKSVFILLINCIISTALIFLLFLIIFDTYAAEGYGYDELDGYNNYDDYGKNDDDDGYNDYNDYINNNDNNSYNGINGNSGNNGYSDDYDYDDYIRQPGNDKKVRRYGISWDTIGGSESGLIGRNDKKERNYI